MLGSIQSKVQNKIGSKMKGKWRSAWNNTQRRPVDHGQSGGQCHKREEPVWKEYDSVVLTMLCLSFFLQITVLGAQQSLLQHGIAEEVLRFHVLANSDSEEDQNVKLLVRDAVLDWLKVEMELETGTKAEMEAFLAEHLEEITEVANRTLAWKQMAYRATAALEMSYFPERTYGTCTFPAGWYQALRIRLGRAEGHNWWCVLYPRLCFTDCLHAVVEEDQIEQLDEVLTEKEFDSLLHEPKQWKLSFRWF